MDHFMPVLVIFLAIPLAVVKCNLESVHDCDLASSSNKENDSSSFSSSYYNLDKLLPCLNSIYCPCNLLYHQSNDQYKACLRQCIDQNLYRCPCDALSEEYNTLQDVSSCYLTRCNVAQHVSLDKVRVSAFYIATFILLFVFFIGFFFLRQQDLKPKK